MLKCLQIVAELTVHVSLSLSLSGEFGDYDPSEHQPGYLDEFNMLQDEVSVVWSLLDHALMDYIEFIVTNAFLHCCCFFLFVYLSES